MLTMRHCADTPKGLRPHQEMSSRSNTVLPCPLLCLPRELRDRIYEYAFSDARYVGARNLLLLLTCRQVHVEAGILGFSLTNFFVEDLHVGYINRRLRKLSEEQIESIKHLSGVAFWFIKTNTEYVGGPFLSQRIPLARLDLVLRFCLPGKSSCTLSTRYVLASLAALRRVSICFIPLRALEH